MNDDNPNTPRYFRLLEKGEELKDGDTWLEPHQPAGGGIVGIGVRNSTYYRPVQVDEWISYAERKPTKEDANPQWHVHFLFNNGTSNQYQYDYSSWAVTPAFWRRITPPQPAKPKSVRLEIHRYRDGARIESNPEITPSIDGSAKMSCGDVISAESIDEFIKAREEVTKKILG